MKQLKKWLLEHPNFRLAQEIKTLCSPLQQFGITHFSHVNINDGKFSLISQNPAFLRHYIEADYFNFDVIQFEPQSHEQYLIRDLQSLTGKTKQLQEDFNAYGFGHSFSIVNSSSSQIDFYNFATHFGNHAINELYLQQLASLKQFIYYFHDKVNRHKELKKAYGYELYLHAKESGFQLQHNPEEQDLHVASINRIYIQGKNVFLTLREYECLSWLAKGKTQEQIALILNISLRTVKAHIAQIRKKTNCVNQFQLGLLFSEIGQGLKIAL